MLTRGDGVIAIDAPFMDRALFLAERGRGRTAPNPLVGAVLVSPSGVVVGQGAHLEAGGPHAEIAALAAAGPRARGATLYCTLEPCCHTGRTGPCAPRIAEAGVSRVVAAVRDPNPRVAGKGLAFLSARGVDVSEGQGAAEARRLNAPFFTWIKDKRPLVTLKVAVSADGFVGRADARVKLTGPAANRWLHRQRAEVDAIAVGSGTVLVDDPRLTPRGAYRFRPLTRAVIDWRLRIPPQAAVFSTLAAGPVIMVVTSRAAAGNPERVAALEARGATVERFDERNLQAVVERLAAMDVLTLLVEGGPELHAAFAGAGLVDRIERVLTPHRLATGVRESGATSLEGKSTAAPRRTVLGDDVLIEADVHRTD